MDVKAVWEAAKGRLSQTLGERVYQLWIEQIDLREIDEDRGVAVITVPNETTKTYIQSQYSFIIADAISRAADRPGLEIEVVVEPRQSPPEPQPVKPATRPPRPAGIGLNPERTFDSFVKGPSNRLAYEAARKVAEKPGLTFNPLFIYGGVGLGKTHLLHAIGNYVMGKYPNLKVRYMQAKDFTEEYVDHIRRDKHREFREKYRAIDVLLVDDIQFLTTREATQEEFFHIFNVLYENQKQIVIASDRRPQDLKDISERLRTRFGWGLIADIAPPSLEERFLILKKKAALWGINVPDHLLELLASKISSNVRELEAALRRLNLFIEMEGISEPTEADLKRALPELFSGSSQDLSVEDIKGAVSQYFGISVKELEGKRRTKNIAYARQVAMYLARELLDMSTTEVGKAFGGRDHSTVIHAYDKIKKLAAKDSRTRRDLLAIKRALGVESDVEKSVDNL